MSRGKLWKTKQANKQTNKKRIAKCYFGERMNSKKWNKLFLRKTNQNNQCKPLICTFKLRIINLRLNRCCIVLGMWNTTYLFLFLESKKASTT